MATWVGPPKHWHAGRERSASVVVIHTTEGAEMPLSAEAGAAYDKTRPDEVSTHLFVDSDSAVREVRDEDTAYHARAHGNAIGIGVEICGRAGQTAEQWHDGASTAELRIAAREVALLCKLHDIPPRRLSVAEVRAAYYAAPTARPRGICGHIDVTRAFPEDAGSHFDPGPAFPWSEFLGMVASELEDDMAEVYFRVECADQEWNGKAFVSNRIHRRQLRAPGEIQRLATAGATVVRLTDKDRLGVSATETWPAFLDAVAGPVFPAAPAGQDHTHAALTTLGPPAPTG